MGEPVSDHELAFMKRLLLALGRHPSLRVWRQNVGHVPIRDERGRVVRTPQPDADEDDEQRRMVGDLLDLEPVLRDAVVLDLPLAPVCRDDCPGLCPQCGFRLEDDPEHHHDVIDIEKEEG